MNDQDIHNDICNKIARNKSKMQGGPFIYSDFHQTMSVMKGRLNVPVYDNIEHDVILQVYSRLSHTVRDALFDVSVSLHIY